VTKTTAKTAETIEFPTFDATKATDQMRAFAEKGVEQSKEAYDKMKTGAETTQKALEETFEAARASGSELSLKSIAALRAAPRILRVRPGELLEVRAGHGIAEEVVGFRATPDPRPVLAPLGPMGRGVRFQSLGQELRKVPGVLRRRIEREDAVRLDQVLAHDASQGLPGFGKELARRLADERIFQDLRVGAR
jgi:hypothetical protein